jgi:uncharacterized membrane protein YebE (DUF533 family)
VGTDVMLRQAIIVAIIADGIIEAGERQERR